METNKMKQSKKINFILSRLLFTVLGITLLCCIQLPSANAASSLDNITYNPRGMVSGGGGTHSGAGLDYLQPLFGTNDQLFYMDINGHYQINQPWAGSAELGYRHLVDSSYPFIWGVYGGYDYIRSTHDFAYNQMNLGAEWLSHRVDVRINGYIPVSDGHNIYASTATPAPLSGYKLAFESFHQYETMQKAVDTDVGVALWPALEHPLWAYTGYYHAFASAAPGYNGISERLEQTINQYLRVDVSYQYDGQFHSQWFAGLRVYFGGVKHSSNNILSVTDALQSRMTDVIERRNAYAGDYQKYQYMVSPFNVYYVKNGANGNGSYESPYGTIAAADEVAQSGDIIYVYAGGVYKTGSTITLSNGNTLMGSAAPLTYDNVLFIPAGNAPVIADALVLGSNSTVSGINMDISTLNTTGITINGNNNTLSNIQINNSNINNANAVMVVGGSNNQITNVSINNAGQGDSVNIIGNANTFNAMTITNSGLGNSVSVGGNNNILNNLNIANSNANNIHDVITMEGSSNQINTAIINNASKGAGIVVGGNSNVLNAMNITNSNADNHNAAMVIEGVNNHVSNAAMVGNAGQSDGVVINGFNNIFFNLNFTDEHTAMVVNGDNNQITNVTATTNAAQSEGLVINGEHNVFNTINLANVGPGTTADGVEINGSNNQIDNLNVLGFYYGLFLDGNADQISIDHFTIANSFRNGIRSADGSQLTGLSFTNGSVTNSGSAGINLRDVSGLTLSNLTVSDNHGDGIDLIGVQNATLDTISVLNNDDGVGLLIDNDTSFVTSNLTLSNITATGNAYGGIDILVSGTTINVDAASMNASGNGGCNLFMNNTCVK